MSHFPSLLHWNAQQNTTRLFRSDLILVPLLRVNENCLVAGRQFPAVCLRLPWRAMNTGECNGSKCHRRVLLSLIPPPPHPTHPRGRARLDHTPVLPTALWRQVAPTHSHASPVITGDHTLVLFCNQKSTRGGNQAGTISPHHGVAKGGRPVPPVQNSRGRPPEVAIFKGSFLNICQFF